jgi:S1-C subfamily serine protease
MTNRWNSRCAVAALFVGAILAPDASKAQNVASTKAQHEQVAASAMAMFDTSGSFAPMLARVLPAVVTILVTGETAQPVELEARRSDGTLPPLPVAKKETFRSGGSGVIIDRARGHILTNSHVVEDAVRIEVSLADGRRMLARVVGLDAATDVAVIEVAERDLPELPVGDSDQMRVGDLVAAIGNPYGLEGTATLGIVSALSRTDGAFEDFMQIDASIHPGNSGGALVNAKGELVGINTAGSGERGKGAGIGFAIPINMARRIKAELIAHGRMKRGAPGLVVEDLSHEVMNAMKTTLTRGAHILEVVPGSPAAAAGIRPGGLVVSIANKPVRNAGEFNTRVGTVPAGTVLPIVIHIDGKDITYNLPMADIALKPAEVQVPRGVGGLAGAIIGEINLGHPLYGQMRGVLVLRVPMGTPAYATGLALGDIIVALDGGQVRVTEDLWRLIDRSGMQYRVKVIRDGTPGVLRVTR